MKRSTLGILAAAAVASLLGSPVLAAEGSTAGEEAKACYRTKCGESVSGHEGKCGGTKVEGVNEQKACETAGGAWTTAKDAKKYEKM